MSLFSSETFDTGCQIEIEQSPDHFHAHVRLDGDIPIYPGDKVLVHGEPIMVSFGEKVAYDRTATVERAGPLKQLWTKIAGHFEMAELYEVSFNPGRL
ncbi:hypothetical protein [Alterisphingorhabdus coralli]|uniref:Uncharacterized protein n=1 Tax=Alterisphingorhabdus coralli TaxID=3071408 RepID=A0AA97F790_9SPHN|nr:hypothetical protein [Parasphingorhabdus sp. SCSIO 66989]WOE74542.1 hypothetical protein RB602_11890 [Parasphingorhabdus sp. SCSIO 66989]